MLFSSSFMLAQTNQETSYGIANTLLHPALQVCYSKAPCCENPVSTPGKNCAASAVVFLNSAEVFTDGQDVPSGKHTEPI